MRPNNGGSCTDRILRHIHSAPAYRRSTPAVHHTPQKRDKKPVRNSGLFPESQHTFRIDAPRYPHGWRWAAAPSNPDSGKQKQHEENRARPLGGGGHPRPSGRARPAQAERSPPRHERFGLRPADLSGPSSETNAGREKAASRSGTHRIEPEPARTLGQYL